jgi:hypothetical protein
VLDLYVDQDCENARKEFKCANKKYFKNRLNQNIELLVNNRRLYRIAKRRARTKFHLNQRKKMSFLAGTQPQKFWKEIKKKRKKSSKNELSSEDFFEHLKNLFSNE